jgi:GT2 family glycosyltransferase
VTRSERSEITAVIVTYESSDVIGSCLDSLAPAYEAGFAECVVVDNASHDGTASFVADRYPWVRLVRSCKNLGYGSGCNLGLRAVVTPYVLFMNPDVALGLDALKELVRFARCNSSAGLIGPAIVWPKGGYQHADALPTPRAMLRSAVGLRGSNRRPILPDAEPFTTNWICGAAMVAPTKVVREVGGFDPRFFLYFEETDLCLRVAKAGYQLWTCPSAVTTHLGGASARKVKPDLRDWGCLPEHYYPSRFYDLGKHYGLPSAVAVDLVDLSFSVLADLARIVRLRKRRRRLVDHLRRPLLSYPQRRPPLSSGQFHATACSTADRVAKDIGIRTSGQTGQETRR